MLARTALLFKWSVYLGTILLCVLMQAVLNPLPWEVIPFLYPVMVAVMATYDHPHQSACYGLVMGLTCDLLIPHAVPCFYTLLFPATAAACSWVAKSLIRSGFLCSVMTTTLAFTFSALFHFTTLALRGHNPFPVGLHIAGTEFALSVIFAIPFTVAFRYIKQRSRYDD